MAVALNVPHLVSLTAGPSKVTRELFREGAGSQSSPRASREPSLGPSSKLETSECQKVGHSASQRHFSRDHG